MYVYVVVAPLSYVHAQTSTDELYSHWEYRPKQTCDAIGAAPVEGWLPCSHPEYRPLHRSPSGQLSAMCVPAWSPNRYHWADNKVEWHPIGLFCELQLLSFW